MTGHWPAYVAVTGKVGVAARHAQEAADAVDALALHLGDSPPVSPGEGDMLEDAAPRLEEAASYIHDALDYLKGAHADMEAAEP